MKTINRKIKGFSKATIKEDDRYYYISLFSPASLTQLTLYDKSVFSLDDAIKAEIEMESECLI